jgi:WD40 repeat protein
VTKKWIEGGGDTKIFSLKWSYDDKYLAAACESGEVRVYNSKTG